MQSNGFDITANSWLAQAPVNEVTHVERLTTFPMGLAQG